MHLNMVVARSGALLAAIITLVATALGGETTIIKASPQWSPARSGTRAVVADAPPSKAAKATSASSRKLQWRPGRPVRSWGVQPQRPERPVTVVRAATESATDTPSRLHLVQQAVAEAPVTPQELFAEPTPRILLTQASEPAATHDEDSWPVDEPFLSSPAAGLSESEPIPSNSDAIDSDAIDDELVDREANPSDNQDRSRGWTRGRPKPTVHLVPDGVSQEERPFELIEGEPLSTQEGPQINCEDEYRQLRAISELTVDIAPNTEGVLPKECPLQHEDYTLRSWAPATYTWNASGLCHKPLYFEQVAMERYGHTPSLRCGPLLAPIVSGAHFFATVPILPYKMGVNPPWECQYSLGYYRPGSCAPYIIPPVPLSVRGAAVQGVVVTGAVVAFP